MRFTFLVYYRTHGTCLVAEKCCPISVKRKLKIEANMLLCKTLMKFYVIIFALYFGGAGGRPAGYGVGWRNCECLNAVVLRGGDAVWVWDDADHLPSLQRAQPSRDVINYVIRLPASAAGPTLYHTASMLTILHRPYRRYRQYTVDFLFLRTKRNLVYCTTSVLKLIKYKLRRKTDEYKTFLKAVNEYEVNRNR